MTIERYVKTKPGMRYSTFLFRADFTIFNVTYGTADQEGMCTPCNGTGGFVTTELMDDPPMTGYQDTFESCSDCIGDEKCPGCGTDLKLSFDLSAFGNDMPPLADQDWDNFIVTPLRFNYEDALAAMPFEGFTCLCCGWQYDPARHYDQADDYTDYDFEADQDWQASAYHRVDPFEDWPF